ncbi:thermonuclease family protein [Pyrobaculum islandicum]|uniref:thermonuclease family protein n=1 Tax=Pyrobaculum islandicum TaxID=2277 RepID=UPI001432EA51|nr:hypothetical protein [Pyrobaculum islandicum]
MCLGGEISTSRLTSPLFSDLAINATVVVVEMPDVDAQRVAVWRAIDGDTVETSVGRVRLVGYDAWEWDEPHGPEARYFLIGLCGGTDYLDVDDLEPRDRYGRILGYLWCGRVFEVGGIYYTAYASVQKAFLLVRPDLVKRPLYIPPDEHPYWRWLKHFTVAFDRVDREDKTTRPPRAIKLLTP